MVCRDYGTYSRCQNRTDVAREEAAAVAGGAATTANERCFPRWWDCSPSEYGPGMECCDYETYEPYQFPDEVDPMTAATEEQPCAPRYGECKDLDCCEGMECRDYGIYTQCRVVGEDDAIAAAETVQYFAEWGACGASRECFCPGMQCPLSSNYVQCRIPNDIDPPDILLPPPYVDLDCALEYGECLAMPCCSGMEYMDFGNYL